MAEQIVSNPPPAKSGAGFSPTLWLFLALVVVGSAIFDVLIIQAGGVRKAGALVAGIMCVPALAAIVSLLLTRRSLAGVGWGAAVGTLIALVLVHRVNPQSFHWTMDLAWPWPLLAASAVALVCLGVLAAVLASRAATGETPVRAVHADW